MVKQIGGFVQEFPVIARCAGKRCFNALFADFLRDAFDAGRKKARRPALFRLFFCALFDDAFERAEATEARRIRVAEAACRLAVAGRTLRLDMNEERIRVAIRGHRHH